MAGRGTISNLAALPGWRPYVLANERHGPCALTASCGCARWGRPGIFISFISMEDDLMRLWRLGQNREYMSAWDWRKGRSEHPLLNHPLAAQKRIEQHNFQIPQAHARIRR
jgi:preprotein translocase subunit SecA